MILFRLNKRNQAMDRQFYLDLARRGSRMPIGTDLVLHEDPEPERTRNDGCALGRVIERAARRWHTTLAVPLMDLRLEKMDLVALAGVPPEECDKFHFPEPLEHAVLEHLLSDQPESLCAGSTARNEALT